MGSELLRSSGVLEERNRLSKRIDQNRLKTQFKPVFVASGKRKTPGSTILLPRVQNS